MNSPEKQLLIGFHDIKVTQLQLRFSGPNHPEELTVFVDFEPVFYPEKEKQRDFALDFTIKMNNDDGTLFIEVHALAYFKTTQIIDENFRNSDWVKVNAPAIAFPFLRAYISTVTLNSGISPVILPAFNFTKLKNKPVGH